MYSDYEREISEPGSYYVHFRANSFVKDMNSAFSSPSLGNQYETK